MERIMVIGGSGLLGSKVLKESTMEFDTIGTYNSHPFSMKDVTTKDLDIRDEKEVEFFIQNHNPDYIVLTAAFTNVDKCELNKKDVFDINVKGTSNVVKVAEKLGTKLLYISTDYVFDGTKGFYKENDEPNPINYYGKTKLEGEIEVRNNCKNYVICRVSSLYGWNIITNKQNFATWVIQKLKSKDELTLFADQHTTPTFVDNIAEVIIEICKTDRKGIYHLASSECISRFEFGMKVAEIFQFDKNLIRPITTENLNLPAKRPKKCCLDISKAKKELKTKLLTVEEALTEMKRQEGLIK